jgi:hypothetical protein
MFASRTICEEVEVATKDSSDDDDKRKHELRGERRHDGGHVAAMESEVQMEEVMR